MGIPLNCHITTFDLTTSPRLTCTYGATAPATVYQGCNSSSLENKSQGRLSHVDHCILISLVKMIPLNHLQWNCDQTRQFPADVQLQPDFCFLVSHSSKCSSPFKQPHKSVAEICLSSLKAGSASIQRKPYKTVHFTELPVSLLQSSAHHARLHSYVPTLSLCLVGCCASAHP